jgi:hypothetical protein
MVAACADASCNSCTTHGDRRHSEPRICLKTSASWKAPGYTQKCLCLCLDLDQPGGWEEGGAQMPPVTPAYAGSNPYEDNASRTKGNPWGTKSCPVVLGVMYKPCPCCKGGTTMLLRGSCSS